MFSPPVVDLICRYGSQKFEDKSIPVEIGKPISLARCAEGDDKVSNGLFCAAVVSRIHAEVNYENGKFFMNDMGSVNGSFVNSHRLSKSGEKSGKVAVTCGDIVQLGCEVTQPETGVKFSPIIFMVELKPCNCTSHESQISSSLKDEVSSQQSESLLAQFPSDVGLKDEVNEDKEVDVDFERAKLSKNDTFPWDLDIDVDNV